jgi:peptidase M28-like protein
LSPKRLLILIFLICLSSQAQNNSSTYPPADLLARIRPEGLKAQMGFLSDDLLEGRYTGTRGYYLAAKYVASQFQEMGLKPAGDNGTYLQNIRFRKVELDRDHSSFSFTVNGQEKSPRFFEEFAALGNELNPDSSFEGPVVFVGYGVTAPEFNYDDYAGADVKGKIVAYLYGAPAKFPSALRAHHSSSTVKAANAASHGAIGIIGIWAGSIAERSPFSRYARHFRYPRVRWLDENGQPNDAQPQLRGGGIISSEVADRMFAGSPKSFKDALVISVAGTPQSFPLAASAKFHLVSKHSEFESPNIAAILPGSDPKLKNEYVLYSAHADHMGIGEAVNADTIYNGTLDNASGTSGVLEIARAMSSMPKAPRRSILFLIVTGEEEGLLGSDAYAHHPTVPIKDIVANVNMDEIGAFFDFKDIVPLGAEHSSIGKVVEDVAKRMGLEISPDPAPEEVYFVRSDQYSFIKQGVPAVAIDQGYKAVDPKLDGEKIMNEWEQKYYHQPLDDMNQPYLDFNAAVKSTRLNLAVGYEIAQQTERPRWNKGDFFEKFVKKTQ